MNTSNIRRLVIAFGVSAAAIGGGAAAYGSAQSVPVTTTDTVITTTSSHPLSQTGGVFTNVISASLPVGQVVISANGDLVDWGPSDYTRCRIMVGTRQIAAVSTMVGDNSQPGSNGPSGLLSPFALTGGISLTAPATATLQCWHDSFTSAAAFVDPNATMYVHRSSSLKATTTP